MNEYSSEDIQRAANEVRRTEFGDFMFRDPGFNRGTTERNTSGHGRTSRKNTSRRRNTSRRNTSRHHHTSRRNTSRNRNTSRRNTSRRNTSRHRTSRRNPCKQRKCQNTTHGQYQIERCWEDSNQSYFRMKHM